MGLLRTAAIFFFFMLTLAGASYVRAEDTSANFGMAFILICTGLIGLITFTLASKDNP